MPEELDRALQAAAAQDGLSANGLAPVVPSLVPVLPRRPAPRAGWDYKVTVHDVTYYGVELSDATLDYLNTAGPQALADALGVDVTVIRNPQAIGALVAADASGDVLRAVQAAQEERYRRVFSQAVIGWDDPAEPYSLEALLARSRQRKKLLLDRIVAASEFGASDADFLSPS